MAAVLKHWREAATLLLAVRRTSGKIADPVRKPATAARAGFDLLMLKRSSKSAFMPNLYVFPGGVASDADFSRQWLDVFNSCGSQVREEVFRWARSGGPGAPMFSRERPPEFSCIPSEVAFRICAIRETFEECGVLLVRRKADLVAAGGSPVLTGKPVMGSADVAVSLEGLAEWRSRVDKDARQFLTMCQELDLVPHLWSLYEWANWLTPAHEGSYKRGGRRFDTAFYLCCLDHHPDMSHDEGETTHSLWGMAGEVLASSREGVAAVAPPQQYELSRLQNFPTLEALQDFVHQRHHQHQRCHRILPVRINCSDALLFVMAGDDLYPKEPDLYGESPVLERPESSEELLKSAHLHRNVFKPGPPAGPRQLLYCNVKSPDGHVSPVLDDPVHIHKSLL